MKVVGHTLCWHSQSPAFLFRGPDGKPLPRDEALKNLKDHIDGVMGHFKGKVVGWDVVNEAISDAKGEYLRDTPARRAIGDDYIVKAFEFAHAADPDAELYYNDYGNEHPEKLEKTIRLIRELKAAGRAPRRRSGSSATCGSMTPTRPIGWTARSRPMRPRA